MPRQHESTVHKRIQGVGRARPAAPRAAAGGEAVRSVRSLERALDLLEALERLRAPAGVRALEEITHIPKATAQRLLDVLERRGYAQKDRGRYALAAGTVRLARGFLAGDSLASISLPVLQQLTALSGETCGLYIRQGFDRILVQRVESPHPLRHHTPIGERLPLHIGASGHILCAGMPDDLLHPYLETLGPIRLASGQVLSKKEFLARIQQTRLHGYAIRFDERFAGIGSVAAPVMHKDKGVIAAINIAGPSSRLPADRLEQLSLELINAASKISESLDRL
jgi:IclR family transcriptional regulator, acetate operon repressor